MSVKLTYFDARGLCEPIRWILAQGCIEFEEFRTPIPKVRVPGSYLPEDIKAKCRWGQVPLAEFDGKSLTQSLAISRYFARKAKLVPEDPYLAALCDEYVDAVRDMMNVFYPIAILEDEKEKKEKLAEALKTAKPRFLDVFDGIVKANGGKYLVGGSISWADIWLVHVLDNFNRVLGVDLTGDHENLKNLMEVVMNTEKIKAWVEKRPNTQF